MNVPEEVCDIYGEIIAMIRNMIEHHKETFDNLAKFSDTCSVRADGLCIGSPRLVGGRKVGNSNMQEFFCTTLYIVV